MWTEPCVYDFIKNMKKQSIMAPPSQKFIKIDKKRVLVAPHGIL